MNETDSYLSSSSSSGDEGEGNQDESLSSSESALETSGVVPRHPQFVGGGVPQSSFSSSTSSVKSSSKNRQMPMIYQQKRVF